MGQLLAADAAAASAVTFLSEILPRLYGLSGAANSDRPPVAASWKARAVEVSEHSPAAWGRIDDPHGYRIRYPPGWTVREEAERLTATSPDGQALLLVRAHAEGCAKVETAMQQPLRPNLLPAESAPRHVAGALRPTRRFWDTIDGAVDVIVLVPSPTGCLEIHRRWPGSRSDYEGTLGEMLDSLEIASSSPNE